MFRGFSSNSGNVGGWESTIVLLYMNNAYHILFNTVWAYQLGMCVLSNFTRVKATRYLVWYLNIDAGLHKFVNLQKSL
jgi:hypothetical protein